MLSCNVAFLNNKPHNHITHRSSRCSERDDTFDCQPAIWQCKTCQTPLMCKNSGIDTAIGWTDTHLDTSTSTVRSHHDFFAITLFVVDWIGTCLPATASAACAEQVMMAQDMVNPRLAIAPANSSCVLRTQTRSLPF
jgi:hypothetical protein